MTRKIFWDDPYRTALVTRISRVEGERVWLDETIIYALSGGQESDRATIEGHEVLLAEKAGVERIYTLAPGHGLAVGQTVATTIDWTRRYRLMRLHFACEIVLEIVTRAKPEWTKIGAHIGEHKARIDFESGEPVTPYLPIWASAANAIVAADRAIRSDYSDPVLERRYWEIGDFARVACGGTHLRRTGEIGTISLKRRNVGRGKERIEILVPHCE